MRRRDGLIRAGILAILLGLEALVSAVAPSVAQGRARQIAILGPAEEPRFSHITAGLEQGLRDQGLAADSFEFVKAKVERGDHEAARTAVRGFLQTEVSVVFVIGSELARVARQVSPEFPIVFITPGDPVAAGLVKSLSHPGGNTTAMTFEFPDLSAKRLEIIRYISPAAERVLVLYDPRDASSRLALASAREAAPKLGLRLIEREVVSRSDVLRGLEALGAAQAFLAVPGGAPSAAYSEIIQTATSQGVPTVFHGRTESTKDALASYGASDTTIARQAARLVAKILGGEKAGDLPVERPTSLELTLNLRTAKALGLTIPPTLLAGADELIE
jgi:putative tryptophan/tyrosine transport system substrate-binding protein